MRNLLITLLFCTASSLVAEAPKGFWEKASIRDMSLTPVANSSRDLDFEYGTARRKFELGDPQDFKKEAKSEAEAPSVPLTSRDAVLAKYGDPSKNREVALDPSASPELKGMAAALNIGDKELAFQYARAHVRYQKEINQFVDRSSEYQIAAMELEGIRPPEADKEETADPYRQELRDIMDKAEKEVQPKVTKKVEALIANEEVLHNRELTQAKLLEEKNKLPQKKIPVDPAGNVKIYTFFSFDDEYSLKALNSVLELRKHYVSDPRVEFRGFISGGRKPSEIEALRKQFKIDFPVITGEALGKELRITLIPTIVFVAAHSGDTYLVQGEREVSELEKIVREMQGEAK